MGVPVMYRWKNLSWFRMSCWLSSALVCTSGPLMPGLLLVPLCCQLQCTAVCTATVKEGSSLGLPRVDLLGMVYKKRAVKKGFGGNHTPIQEFGQNLWLEYNIVIHLPYPLCKNGFQNRCLEKFSPVFLSFP